MPKSLKHKAVSGMIWTTVERFSQQSIQFVISIFVARILAPSDYGIIGMTSIFFAVANTLLDSGFGSALIKNKNRTEIDYSTCFYFNVIVGIALYAAMFFSSPYIADFYHTPLLSDVIRILALTLLINSLTISQTARLTAEMRFKQLSVVSVTTQMVMGLVCVWGAYIGWGVWALVVQQVGSSVLRLLIIQWFLRWRPMLVFSKESFLYMFSFGWKLLCSGMINTIYNNLYTLVIGRTFSPVEVGYYNRANHFAVMPSHTMLSVVMKVAYPLMSEVQDDDEKLKLAYQKIFRIPIFVLYPVLMGMIALSEPMIRCLIGEKWLSIVPLIQVLCIGHFFSPLTHINLNVLYVKGRTDLVLKLELIKKPIAFLLIFGMLPLGLFWLCAGHALYSFIAYCINCYYTKRYIDFGFWQQLWYNVPVIAKSAIMGLASYSCVILFDSCWLQMGSGILVGMITYALLVFLTHDESYEDLKNILRDRIKKISV